MDELGIRGSHLDEGFRQRAAKNVELRMLLTARSLIYSFNLRYSLNQLDLSVGCCAHNI